MSNHLRSNVVAYVALFLSLGLSGAWAVSRDSVGSRHVRDDSLRSRDIRDGQIRARDLAGGSVRNRKIADGAVGRRHLAPGSVGAANLLPNSVGAANLLPDSVGAENLLPDSVTQESIQDDAVGFPQIGERAVGSAAISDHSLHGDDVAHESGALAYNPPSIPAHTCIQEVLELDQPRRLYNNDAFAVTFEHWSPGVSVTTETATQVNEIVLHLCNPTDSAVNEPATTMYWVAFETHD